MDSSLDIPELKVLKPSEHKLVFTDFLALRQGINISRPHPVASDMAQKSGDKYTLGFIDLAMRAARSMTSSDLPELIGNVIRQLPTPTFTPIHRKFCKIDPVQNFKLSEYVYGIDDLTVQAITELEEIHCQPIELQDTTGQIKHYRTRLSVSRKIWINNSQWLITATNAMFAALLRKEATLVYDALESGTPGHIETGAELDSLRLAIKLFRGLTTSTGELLGAEPKFFIVPAEHEFTAREEVRSGALEGKIEVIGRSGLTASYLLPDPAEYATILLQVYGNAEGLPQILTNQPKSGTDNVVILDGYHDVNPIFIGAMASVKLTT